MAARVLLWLVMVAMVLIGGAGHGCWSTIGASDGC